MRTFRLTNKAKADLRAIATFTQKKWGIEQRKVYLRQIDEAFQLLSRTPDIAISCDFVKTGYRKFPVVSHVIFFKILSDKELQIVRVLHKRMDVKSSPKDHNAVITERSIAW